MGWKFWDISFSQYDFSTYVWNVYMKRSIVPVRVRKQWNCLLRCKTTTVLIYTPTFQEFGWKNSNENRSNPSSISESTTQNRHKSKLFFPSQTPNLLRFVRVNGKLGIRIFRFPLPLFVSHSISFCKTRQDIHMFYCAGYCFRDLVTSICFESGNRLTVFKV